LAAIQQEQKATPGTPTTVQPRSSGYYTASEIQQYQSIHGAGAMPPNYKAPQPPAQKPVMPKTTQTTQSQTEAPQDQSRQPVISISETQLAKTDALRQQQGLQSLESQYSLLVLSYKTNTEPTVKVSESTLAKSDTLRQQQGLQSLEKTVPLQITSYSSNTGIETKQTEYVQTNPFKQTIGAFLAPAAYIGLSVLSGLAKTTGQTILGIKPDISEQEISLKIQKTFGTKETDPVGTILSKDTTIQEKANIAIGSGAFFGLGLVGGLKGKTPKIKTGEEITTELETKVSTKTTSATTVNEIPKGVSEPKGEIIGGHFPKQSEEEMFSRYPLMNSIKQVTTKAPIKFTEQQINLGKGLGREQTTEGGTVSTKGSPKEPPGTKPPEEQYKEIVTKSGILLQKVKTELKEQIIKEQKQEAKQPNKLASITKEKAESKTSIKKSSITDIMKRYKQSLIQENISKLAEKQTTKESQPTLTKQTHKRQQVQKYKYKQPTSTRQTQQEPQVQKYKYKQPTSTRQTQPEPQVQKYKYKQPTLTRTEPQRKPPIGLLKPEKRIPYEKPKTPKGLSKEDFIGNVPLIDIVGVEKRQELIYGKESRRIAEKELNKKSGKLKF